MADPDRIARLRGAQLRIVARLDDPRTPGYSVAPLSNQLRLIERELARLTADENVDRGLPDPFQFGLVTAFSFARWLRGPSVPARHKPGNNDYRLHEAEIFQAWREAGFQLSPKPETSGDADLDRVELESWVERQGAELARCLEIDT